jgi:hypothetical protein
MLEWRRLELADIVDYLQPIAAERMLKDKVHETPCVCITPPFSCRRLLRRRAERAFAVALQGAQTRWLP